MSEQSVPGSPIRVWDVYGGRPIVKQPGAALLHIHRSTNRLATFTFSRTLTKNVGLTDQSVLHFAWGPEDTLVLKMDRYGSKVRVRRRTGEAYLTKTLDAQQLDSLMKYAGTALFRVDVRVQPTGTEIIVRDQVKASPPAVEPIPSQGAVDADVEVTSAVDPASNTQNMPSTPPLSFAEVITSNGPAIWETAQRPG